MRDTADLARSGTRGSLLWMQPPLIYREKRKLSYYPCAQIFRIDCSSKRITGSVISSTRPVAFDELDLPIFGDGDISLQVILERLEQFERIPIFNSSSSFIYTYIISSGIASSQIHRVTVPYVFKFSSEISFFALERKKREKEKERLVPSRIHEYHSIRVERKIATL